MQPFGDVAPREFSLENLYPLYYPVSREPEKIQETHQEKPPEKQGGRHETPRKVVVVVEKQQSLVRSPGMIEGTTAAPVRKVKISAEEKARPPAPGHQPIERTRIRGERTRTSEHPKAGPAIEKTRIRTPENERSRIRTPESETRIVRARGRGEQPEKKAAIRRGHVIEKTVEKSADVGEVRGSCWSRCFCL